MRAVANACIVGFVVVVCMAACSVSAAGSSSMSSHYRSRGRTIRGFKNAALSTARGFGKRSEQVPEGVFDDMDDAKTGEFFDSGFPAEWFVREVTRDPRLARLIVGRFVDSNQDGTITADELTGNGSY